MTLEEDDIRRAAEAFENKSTARADLPPAGGNSNSKRSDEFLAGLRAAAVSGQAFRELKITPRKKLLDDWFREGDAGFIFSPRGVGKTMLAWSLARAIAGGKGVGPWLPGVEAVPVCYLDGEMPAELMQEREKGFDEPSNENLTLINHEILFERTGLVLNLARPEVQKAIMQWCIGEGCKVLVIDNLSTLVSGVRENDADDWEILLPWLLDLRRRKIAVVLVHHAGRSGEMRGTSRREDSVFWIIKLEEEEDYNGPGCSFLVQFTKNRNSALTPDNCIWTFKPTKPDGIVEITYRVASFETLVFGKIREGALHCTVIAQELGRSPSSVSKAAKKLEEEGKITISGRRYQVSPSYSLELAKNIVNLSEIVETRGAKK